MGWSKRENGKQYGSLNGYGAIIGYFSGKVLDLATLNCACKVCESEILLDAHDLGIFAADNDSSSICAIRKKGTHYIVKFNDFNHTKKGVTNYLYHINGNEDLLKELKKDAKDYLRKCFAYAVSQNIGDIEKLKQILQNKPNHVFNIHDNCGEWCKYKDNQENSKSYKSLIGFKVLNYFRN
ncbi:hypothetical protein PV327_008736 [Microctonus hyperodae]|uniref:Mutator-like transposase domain-containing protein n=1 Tax=Microctonus hyperodae TaxID=165561 RepID=A0AA39FSN1_MICHY|nr:hypothetical protein PV327_008736 [Microctonus hyperodae]